MKLITERHVEHIEEYRLNFDRLSLPGSGYSFECDSEGHIDLTKLTELQLSSWEDAHSTDFGPGHVEDYSRDFRVDAVKQCDCGSGAYLSRSCGVFICSDCGEHEGLARCYCGWSLSGRSGYQELVEMGETIEDDY